MSADLPLPRLDAADRGVRARHLLALPGDVGPDEVEVLALSRFPAARWEDTAALDVPSPRTGLVPVVTAAFGIRAVTPAGPPPGARVLRLARLTTLVGPFRVDPDDAVRLGLPIGSALVWDVTTPRERGRPPYPGGDRDGLKRAFPDGMPVREEERVLQWLVAAARRLGGAVRIGTSDRAGAAVVLQPDVDSAIDLVVLSDRWLEPEQAVAVVQRVEPRARLSQVRDAWRGPMPGAGRAAAGVPAGLPEAGGRGLRSALERHGVLDEDERARLAAEAAAFDRHMLASPPPPESFGVLVDLDVDGTIAVEVAEQTDVPPLLRDLPWVAGGVVAYRVRWEPMLTEELEAERPSFEHRVARGRAAPRVQAIARVVHAAVGGEIADEADFLVDPADL